MSVSVNAPKTPVTEGSNGIAAATVPNVCKMPGPPAPFVPTPLPSIGKSGNSPEGYSTTVTIEGKKVAIRGATFKSTGDVASKGSGGGLVSSNTEGPTRFVGPGSMDVKIEGKNVQLLGDPMLNNCGPSGSPPNAATLLGVLQASGRVIAVQGGECPVCARDHRAFSETEKTRADAGILADEFGVELGRAFPDAAPAQADADRAKAAAARKKDAAARARADAERTKAAAARARAAADASAKAHKKSDKAAGAATKATLKAADKAAHLAADDAAIRASIGADAAATAEAEARAAAEDAERAAAKAEKARPRVATMLGVIRCRCGKGYADQSGATSVELCAAAYRAGLKHQRDITWSVSRKHKPTDAEELKKLLAMRVFDPGLFSVAWEKGQELSRASAEDKSLPSAYPPGACAAQKTMVLLLEEWAIAAAMTERWFNSSGNMTAGKIRYVDAREEPRVAKAEQFEVGATVPPCGTCDLLLPYLLCAGERTECNHP